MAIKTGQPHTLSPGLRLVVAGVLLLLVATTIYFFARTWSFLGDGSPYNLVLVSAALLLVLGAYVSEPFFTKPVDALINSIALVITLLGIRDKESFFGFWPAIVVALVLLLISIFVVATPPTLFERAKLLAYRFITLGARSVLVFAGLYVLILISYFVERPAEFWALLTLLIVLCAKRPIEAIVLKLVGLRRSSAVLRGARIGSVVGRLNPRLVLVHRETGLDVRAGEFLELPTHRQESVFGEVLYDIHRASGTDTVIELLGEANQADTLGEPSQIPLSTPMRGDAYLVESESIRARLLRLRDADPDEIVVGYVGPGSTVESLLVEIPESAPQEPALKLAAVVNVRIRAQDCMYQVVDALTVEERIALGDARGFTSFRAQPLGKYDASTRELSPPQWIPEIYTPVKLRKQVPSARPVPDSIGLLPNTELSVPLHAPGDLVTHNTAILGILGIGKSSLTFELIQKVLATTSARVVCIDITNEYGPALHRYTTSGISADDVNAFNGINSRYAYLDTANHEASGNVAEYRSAVRADLLQFLFSSGSPEPAISGAKRVRIYNPDFHKVSKGDKVGYHVFTTDLSQAEKTRVIAEQLFRIVRDLGPALGEPRVLVVLEEAHSLVPEWNAAAHEGDRTATNGTAKVVMQGRKYGMGCFVITQRTANVSKSILNQCNTIFALRVFDDTGKQFLENYVGRRYAGALATLEERHAVAVGRGLRLKQPVIVRLNDVSSVVLPVTTGSTS